MYKEKDEKEIKIKCPNCDCEYLPGEIYIPKYLVGTPVDIERDIYGKILMHEGKLPDYDESFICEKCGRPFKVHAHLSFDVEADSRRDFTQAYSESLYKEDRMYLKED